MRTPSSKVVRGAKKSVNGKSLRRCEQVSVLHRTLCVPVGTPRFSCRAPCTTALVVVRRGPACGRMREEIVAVARAAVERAEARRDHHDDDEKADAGQVDELRPHALRKQVPSVVCRQMARAAGNMPVLAQVDARCPLLGASLE